MYFVAVLVWARRLWRAKVITCKINCSVCQWKTTTLQSLLPLKTWWSHTALSTPQIIGTKTAQWRYLFDHSVQFDTVMPSCEPNWRQVNTVGDRKFLNCFVQSWNAVDYWKQSCLVANSVHTTDKTRQFLSMVWTRHKCSLVRVLMLNLALSGCIQRTICCHRYLCEN